MEDTTKKFLGYISLFLNVLLIVLFIITLINLQASRETNRTLGQEINQLQEKEIITEPAAQVSDDTQNDLAYLIPNPDSWGLESHEEMGVSLNVPEELGYRIIKGKDTITVIDPIQAEGTDAEKPLQVTYWEGKIKSLIDESREGGASVEISWNKDKTVIEITQFTGDPAVYRDYYIFKGLTYEDVLSSKTVRGLYAKVVYTSTTDGVFMRANAAGVANFDQVRGIPDYIARSISFLSE